MSAEKVQKYQPRAPRYVLSFKDNTVLRFAAYSQGSKKVHTRIVNLSESGMAFLLPMLDNPKMDEVIKVQFEAPHGSSIACFAKVVRIDTHRVWDNHQSPKTFKLIAVHFINLPVQQQELIRSGLSKEFKKQRRQYQIQQNINKSLWLIGSLTSWPTKTVRPLVRKIVKKIKGSKKRAEKYVDEVE